MRGSIAWLLVGAAACGGKSGLTSATQFGDAIPNAEAIACLDSSHVAVLTPDALQIIKVGGGAISVVKTLPGKADLIAYDWMRKVDSRLYVSDSTNGGGTTHVYDVTNVEAPVELGTTTALPDFAFAVGTIWYVPDATGFHAIDLADLANPVSGPSVLVYQRVQKFTPTSGLGVAALDGVLIVQSRNEQLTTFDLADPMHPAELQRLAFLIAGDPASTALQINGAVAHEGWLYVGTPMAPGVVDAHDPRAMTVATAGSQSGTGIVPMVDDPTYGIVGIASFAGNGAVGNDGAIGTIDVADPRQPASRMIRVYDAMHQPLATDQTFFDFCFVGGVLVTRDNDSAKFSTPE